MGCPGRPRTRTVRAPCAAALLLRTWLLPDEVAPGTIDAKRAGGRRSSTRPPAPPAGRGWLRSRSSPSGDRAGGVGNALKALLEARGVRTGQGATNRHSGASITVSEAAAEQGVSEPTARRRTRLAEPALARALPSEAPAARLDQTHRHRVDVSSQLANSKEKRAVIEDQLRETPGRSGVWIAEDLGVAPNTGTTRRLHLAGIEGSQIATPRSYKHRRQVLTRSGWQLYQTRRDLREKATRAAVCSKLHLCCHDARSERCKHHRL